jgi:hypothetical protein
VAAAEASAMTSSRFLICRASWVRACSMRPSARSAVRVPRLDSGSSALDAMSVHAELVCQAESFGGQLPIALGNADQVWNHSLQL